MKSLPQRLSMLALVLLLAAVGVWWLLSRQSLEYPRANVLLVTLDTLRADRLGAYGYETAETPRLDALAREGIRFEQVVAPVPLTLPSHTSLMTSMYPPAHGVRDNGAFDLSPGATLLAEVLAEAGYDTGAFVGAYVLHSRWGLDRGFDVYDDRFDYAAPSNLPGQVERRGDAVLDAAVPWLTEDREAPFFGWVHLYDPHTPYTAPEPYASRHTHPYDGEVAYTDSLVGQLIDALDETGALDDTVVVVTADHGEALGDHGEPGHGLFLYDATLLIPLFIRLPDGVRAGAEVSEQIPLIDLAPTILELIGMGAPASFAGASAVPHLSGSGESRLAYSETFFPRFHFGWQELHALRTEEMKYILAPRPELYDLLSDPGELTNLVADRPATAARLRGEVERLRGDEPVRGPGELSPEAEQRLRALGYIGRAPADASDGPLADPKDKIELFQSLTRSQGLLHAGEPAKAEELLERVVAEDPKIVDAQFTLGNARFAQQDYAGAAEAFRATVELSPDYDLALSNLGLAHRRMGHEETARADFEALLLLDPQSPSAHFNLGEMALEAGNPAAARQHFESALEKNDDRPALHFGLGVAAFQLGDVPRSSAAFERTAALAPNYPEVNYYRALVAQARGDKRAEEDFYRAEVETYTRHYRSWFNLSLLLTERGDHGAATEALRAVVEADPDLAIGHFYLARSLIAQENPRLYEEALAAAQRGLGLEPPADQRPLGHYILADIYNRMGNAEAARREAARAEALQRRSGRQR